VTGGAGFIGSNLCDVLLEQGHSVVGVDNFSTGRQEFADSAQSYDAFELVEMDLLDTRRFVEVVDGADAVVHLAANADVRFGWNHPRRDLEQNLVVTHNVLEAMRQTGVGRLMFSSTGSVYGDCKTIPTPEDAPIPVQTSLYGASKFAAEAFIQAYTEGTKITAAVFRFVSIMGSRYTHGPVIDFVRHLRRDPSRLPILGDGRQRKSYLEVTDCVRAMLTVLDRDAPFETFNLGVDDYCTVSDSAGWISERLGLEPEFEFGGGDRGWVGDNPFILLDTHQIRSTGWEPRYGIREAVERTVDFLTGSPHLLEDESIA